MTTNTVTVLVTSCPEHGSVAAPPATARAIARAVKSCARLAGTPAHTIRHLADGDTCWSCCDKMTIH